MSSDNKLGSYITSLMTTIVDKESSNFVKQLAVDELKRLKISIGEFIVENTNDDSDKLEKTKKQLLQEEKENGKSK
tara:strand:+ start:222 stop:449 length:228 start_codon:yes stop_codon:yes gene_type:complete